MRRALVKGMKLNFRWLGPLPISEALSDLVYEVTKLEVFNHEQVCGRLCLYRESEENSRVEDKLLKLATHSEAKYELMEHIHDRRGPYGFFLHEECTGLPNKRDWTDRHELGRTRV